jgi:hypothetical protein
MKISTGIGICIGIIAGVMLVVKHNKRKLTYAEVMKGFLDKKKANPAIVKGTLIKEGEKGHYVITQAFLDSAGDVIDGWKLKAYDLDDELFALFIKNNVVVVE